MAKRERESEREWERVRESEREREWDSESAGERERARKAISAVLSHGLVLTFYFEINETWRKDSMKDKSSYHVQSTILEVLLKQRILKLALKLSTSVKEKLNSSTHMGRHVYPWVLFSCIFSWAKGRQSYEMNIFVHCFHTRLWSLRPKMIGVIDIPIGRSVRAYTFWEFIWRYIKR